MQQISGALSLGFVQFELSSESIILQLQHFDPDSVQLVLEFPELNYFAGTDGIC